MDLKSHPVSSFSLNYFKLISEKNNFFFSPASIYLALSLTAAGSAGQTLKEFQNVLNFQNVEEMGKQISSLNQQLQQSSQSFTISSANRIYSGVQAVTNDYKQFVEKYFQSGFENVNFNQAEAVRENINEWVSQQTREKIKELLKQGTIDASTRMVLVNALYLKADWLYKFQGNNTADRYFYIEPNNEQKKVLTKMMSNSATYGYGKFDGFEYVQLPYQNKDFAMEIFLPSNSIYDLESKLTVEQMQNAMNNSQKTKIKLFLPKFKMNGISHKALDILQNLGIVEALTPQANFSNLCQTENLYISDVIHQAVIEVNEQGTEAAAATAVLMRERCALIINETPEVHCDRPFLFTITHVPTHTVLFLGRITNPQNIN
ncbi:proteinase inhibitor I4 serpin (macronuclear) [Tetrahymena thermophila SB210]|uniref:Proteinase inhibitor I4 serpin n=1 Tax=Tetrahymena thermophila (strain SB210) TaxID=312017 RepID=Q23MN8_TETTS|nr:proteinase inhibitor I4 serpin [Tetrahymena thermophila SB210]EAR97804.1 proteinase inhibitor I4 serpin [Tetrahymena thermophila SB210]|eukprot:XP_001018049.1 proteinase inhibitor I4 serpin [Tetrahymena thermophila SB210]